MIKSKQMHKLSNKKKYYFFNKMMTQQIINEA